MTFVDINHSAAVPLDGHIRATTSAPAAVSFAAALHFDAGGSIGVIPVPVSASGHFTVLPMDLARPKSRLVVVAGAMPPTPGTAQIGLSQGGVPVAIVNPPHLSFPISVGLNAMPVQFF